MIGVLSGRSFDDSEEFVAAFGQGLNKAGLSEHRNIAIEYLWAENHVERLPALAAELVRRQVAVILAVGGVPPAQSAKAATSNIPVVFIIGGDPVKLGLVAGLNRPGGNVTGVTVLSRALTAKRLELLHELRPGVVALAARHGIPAMYFFREFAAVGGLMSYGNSLADAYHRVGIFTGRILRGVKPADLPVEQANKIELLLNLKTAKALDLTFPLTLLALADEVID